MCQEGAVIFGVAIWWGTFESRLLLAVSPSVPLSMKKVSTVRVVIASTVCPGTNIVTVVAISTVTAAIDRRGWEVLVESV